VNLLLDINVILDLVQQRNGFWKPAADLFAAIEAQGTSAFVAGHTITTAYYHPALEWCCGGGVCGFRSAAGS
jgi:hypothetical protein